MWSAIKRRIPWSGCSAGSASLAASGPLRCAHLPRMARHNTALSDERDTPDRGDRCAGEAGTGPILGLGPITNYDETSGTRLTGRQATMAGQKIRIRLKAYDH